MFNAVITDFWMGMKGLEVFMGYNSVLQGCSSVAEGSTMGFIVSVSLRDLMKGILDDVRKRRPI